MQFAGDWGTDVALFRFARTTRWPGWRTSPPAAQTSPAQHRQRRCPAPWSVLCTLTATGIAAQPITVGGAVVQYDSVQLEAGQEVELTCKEPLARPSQDWCVLYCSITRCTVVGRYDLDPHDGRVTAVCQEDGVRSTVLYCPLYCWLCRPTLSGPPSWPSAPQSATSIAFPSRTSRFIHSCSGIFYKFSAEIIEANKMENIHD